MNTKDQKAKEYFVNHPTFMNAEKAFRDGWDAAIEHLANIPATELIGELINTKRHGRHK